MNDPYAYGNLIGVVKDGESNVKSDVMALDRNLTNSIGQSTSSIMANTGAGFSALNTVDPLNVYLAGRFSFNDLISVVGADYNAPSGINANPDQKTFMSIGTYRGTLYVFGSLVAVTLTNGWTQFFSTVTVDARCNQGMLRGRVQVPSTPWVGKEQIGTMPANIAPLTSKFFMGNAFNASNSATVPVLIEVTGGGAISVLYLNTPAVFPATVLWVGLDGIQWNLNE
jgi:hypothetical protein